MATCTTLIAGKQYSKMTLEQKKAFVAALRERRLRGIKVTVPEKKNE